MSPEKRFNEKLGESLREMGVLVLVFYGLSTFIKVEGLGWRELIGAVVAALAGAGLWLIGVNIELKE